MDRMARVLMLILLAGVAAAAAFALVRSGDADRDRGGEEAAESLEFRQVAYAAETTARQPGVRITFTGTGDMPELGVEMQMRGVSVYNAQTRRSWTVTTGNIPSEPEGPFNPIRIKQVTAGDRFYQSSPAFTAGLPDGKTWTLVRLPEGANQAGFDMRGQLDYLKSVGEDVENLGAETVRGVPTTHYTGSIDQEAYIERLRAQGHDEAADQAEQLYEEMPEATSFEVWIDRRDLVRRMSMQIPFDFLAGEGSTIAMTMEMVKFGIKPRISLPPPAEVFDATEISQDALDELTD